MKNIKIPIGVFIAISFVFVCYAIAKTWQSYGLLAEVPADGDHLMINDVSDPTDNAAGTVKRLAWSYVQNRDADLTSIAALSTTAYGRALLESAQPDDGEIIIGDTGNGTPVWANITETGDALTISNGAGTINFVPHANLEAVADAETGVTDPMITMYDDNDGATGTAAIYGTSVDGTKAIVMSIGVEEETTGNAAYIELDGINETVDVLKPLTAPSIDAGIKLLSFNVATNMDSVYGSTLNRAKITMSGAANADRALTLPASGLTSSGDSKEFVIINNETDDYDIILTPSTGDTIYKMGSSADCGADGTYTIPYNRGMVTIYGQSASVWFILSNAGAGDCTS